MNDLFRKEAFENFSSNLKINKGVRAVSIKTAVFVILFLICTAIFAIWLFFGTIYETVSVEGIVWPTQSEGVVYASSRGEISQVTVSKGTYVQSGDIIAVIPQKDILSQIEEGRANNMSEAKREKLYEEYDSRSVVRSNISGIVTYIADKNSYVTEGTKIAAVVPYDKDGNNKILTAFIPSGKSGLVTLGTEVQVMPDFAPKEKYGYIKAYVSSISSYPVKGQNIRETSEELFLPTLQDRESYFQVEITLIPDANMQSHLKWSNPNSGSTDVAVGTMCSADIIIKKCHPYEWLF